MNEETLAKATKLKEQIKIVKADIQRVEGAGKTRHEPHYAFMVGNSDFRADFDDQRYDSKFANYALSIGGKEYREICEVARILLLNKLNTKLTELQTDFDKL